MLDEAAPSSHFFPRIFVKKNLWCFVRMGHFDGANSEKIRVAVLVCGILRFFLHKMVPVVCRSATVQVCGLLPINSRIKVLV